MNDYQKTNKMDPCILWCGKINAKGYGFLSVNRKKVEAHRAIYINIRGTPPPGMVLDHLCRVRHCVNPNHLEAVTRAENTMRGASPPAKNKLKTHCKNGHPLSGENLSVVNGKRKCITCQHAANERFLQARKGSLYNGNGLELVSPNCNNDKCHGNSRLFVDFHGEIISFHQAAKRNGVGISTAYVRLRKFGWTIRQSCGMDPREA